MSFTCAGERDPGAPEQHADAAVGMEAGLRYPAVLSTGEKGPNPQPLRKALRRPACLNRELARRKPGSRNREETRRRLGRVHARVAVIRRDAVHELTTRPSRVHGTVVGEPLQVAGMPRNRRVSRAVADASPAALRRQLGYKTGLVRLALSPVEQTTLSLRRGISRLWWPPSPGVDRRRSAPVGGM